ncbi:hypothetical protein DALLNEIH_00971 [Bacillus sp. B01(2024)]
MKTMEKVCWENVMISKKSRIAAAILAFFLGGFGIHKHLLNVLFISEESI